MVGLYSNIGCCELLFTETFELEVCPIDLCPLTKWRADIFSLHLTGNIWICMNDVYIKWFSSGSWRLSADLKLIMDLSELSISAGASAGLTYVLHSSDLGWCALEVLTCLLRGLLTVANNSETERKWCHFVSFPPLFLLSFIFVWFEGKMGLVAHLKANLSILYLNSLLPHTPTSCNHHSLHHICLATTHFLFPWQRGGGWWWRWWSSLHFRLFVWWCWQETGSELMWQIPWWHKDCYFYSVCLKYLFFFLIDMDM